MVETVNGTLWFENVKKIASFNRYTTGPQIIQAKDFIISSLKSYGFNDIQLENYTIGGTQRWNVITKLTGTEKPEEYYLVGAHLDSTSERPTQQAPGACDDGSGSVALLEIARIFKLNPPKHTMFFIWFTGEEQGLVGSTFSATRLVQQGNKNKVKLMVQMDMNAYKSPNNQHRVLLETSRTFASIVPPFENAAKTYCEDFFTSVSYNPFGSDHVPYINRGIPALLLIDVDYGRYPHYHKSTDLPQYLVQKMGKETTKLAVATLATLMGY